MPIHPSAIIAPDAEVAHDAEIGPYCVVESNAVIGPGSRLAGHVVVKAGTRVGERNSIAEFAVLGGRPQHVAPPGLPGTLRIGHGNQIREHVTMHRSLYADGETVIGNSGMFMAGSHVAHDCHVGDEVVLANDVLLAGHVEIGDRACFGGAAAVQQFCRVGRLAMVGGMARVTRDVPPFMLVDGGSTMIVGLNRVGLRRAEISAKDIVELKSAYRAVYRQGLSWTAAANLLLEQHAGQLSAELAKFLLSGQRGFLQERRTPPGAVLRVFASEPAQESQRRAG